MYGACIFPPSRGLVNIYPMPPPPQVFTLTCIRHRRSGPRRLIGRLFSHKAAIRQQKKPRMQRGSDSLQSFKERLRPLPGRARTDPARIPFWNVCFFLNGADCVTVDKSKKKKKLPEDVRMNSLEGRLTSNGPLWLSQ